MAARVLLFIDMREFSCYLFFVLTLSYTLSGQSASQFNKAQADYYNFQYVSAIEGFQPFLKPTTKFSIKANYYTSMSYFEHGQLSEALDHVIQGSNLAIEQFGEESAEAAYGYIGYGKFYHERHSYDTAKMFYQAALALIDTKDKLVTGEIYSNMAYTMDYNGQFDSALIFYQKAADIMESELGLYHTYTDWLYGSMPYVATNAAAYDRGVKVALKSLEIKKELWGEFSEDHVFALRAVAVAYEYAEDYSEMLTYADKLVHFGEALYGVSSIEYADYLKIKGSAHLGLLDYREATNHFEGAFEINKKLAGSKDGKTLAYLDALADAWYGYGKFDEALNLYQQYLTTVSKSGEQEAVIEKLEDVAKCYEGKGNVVDARKYYMKAMNLKSSGFEHLLPISFISLARLEESSQNFVQAGLYLQKAVEANQDFNHNDQATYSFILNNQGVLLRNMNKYNQALLKLQEALAIREHLFGTQSRQYAQTCNGIGNVYHFIGKDNLALDYFMKVLAIERKEYGSNHPEVASTLVNLANSYSALDQYNLGIGALKEAEDILTSYPDSPILVSVYLNSAISHTELLGFEKAKFYAEKHQALVQKLYGDVSLDMANNWNIQGMILHEESRTEAGLVAYQNALEIYNDLGLKESLEYAATLNNIGVSNIEYQAYSVAEDYFIESLRIYESILPAGHHDIITTKINLGLVEDGKGNYQRAIDHYQDVLKAFGQSLIDTLSAASTYQNMAIAQHMLKDFDGAIASASKGLALYKTKLSNQNALVAGLSNNLAIYYQNQHRTEEATALYLSALAFYESIENNAGIARINLGLSDVATDAGKYLEAIAYADEALSQDNGGAISDVLIFNALVAKIDAYYQLFLETNEAKFLEQSLVLIKVADIRLSSAEAELINESDRVQFAIWKSLLTVIGVKAHFAIYEQNANQSHLADAFYYAEKSKSNVLLQSIKESNIKSYAGINQELVNRERELRTRIEQLEQEVFKLTGKEGAKEQRESISSNLFALKQSYQEVSSELKSNPKYKRINNALEIASLQSIQKGLKESEAVIEYAPGDSTLYTFVITKSDIAVFANRYEEEFDGLVTALRNAIIFKSDAAFDYVSGKLYSIAMKDSEDYFRENEMDISSLVIVPEGPFNYFPFESLKRDGKYLIEDYNIAYSYSMTLSGVLTERETVGNGQLLSFAPVFDNSDNGRLTSGAKDVFVASRSVSTGEVRGFSVNGEFITPLPGTKEEVDALSELVKKKGSRVETLVYDQAKEEVIKSGMMEDYQYIHFATHGFVNEAKPEFSGVFMSQNEDSDEDCVLFASEIYNLNIKADLVTLSACETGLGRMAYGEGIVGLSRAFFYAGAQSLVVSQWQVNDASTAELMVDFYDQLLAGTTKAEALRKAKLKLIASDRFKQPYYWAPFVLVGQ